MAVATRREVLRAAGVLGVAAGVTAAAEAAPALAGTSPRPGSDFVPANQDLHLLRRATYGPTPSSVESLRKMGWNKWLNEQLDPSSIDDSACQKVINQQLPELGWSIGQARSRVKEGEHYPFQVIVGMGYVARGMWSKRQVFEVMCDFWSNHLNITCPSTSDVWSARQVFDRDVVRKHALGRFEDMLIASAYNPAMLFYLNNAESTKLEPNENYGRELLELHTVGVDGGYSEDDMYQSALIMTGFTVNENNGLFKYDTSYHHTGSVQVMDFTHANSTAAGGENVGRAYLKYLASHPSTAKHLAYKLVMRFVNDDPDPALVDELAATYLYHDTAIAPVLKQLFLSDEFKNSVGQKLRKPFEDVMATGRILGYGPAKSGTDGLRSMYWMCSEIGHAPLAWSLPDGYPDDAESWVSAGSTLNRWNRHYSLAGHWAADSLKQTPLRDLLPRKLPKTWGAMIDDLSKRLVFRTMETHHKNVILKFFGKKASDRFESKDAHTEWKMAQTAALILDTPYHGVR